MWNVQDLFIFLDKHTNENVAELSEAKWQLLSTSLKANKEIAKVKEISDLIKKEDFDLCLFTEVGGAESLQNLNKHFLDGAYDVVHLPSNSDRGIDLGILAKKEFREKSEFKFHGDKVFARGALQYELNYDDKNKFRFFLTHLKSKLSKASDFEGRSQRSLEVQKLCSIFNQENQREELASFVCGDFNGIIAGAETEPELKYFKESSQLQDIFEYLKKGPFERGTYTYFNKQGDINLMQLDYALCTEKWKHLIDKDTRIMNFDGSERTAIEISRKQRMSAPSDHYPIFLKIRLN